MSMYIYIWDRQVYRINKFTVHLKANCMLLLVSCKFTVYTLDSLQQIGATYKYHWPISELFHFCSRLVQPITLFTVDSWFFNQSQNSYICLHSVCCSANQWAITLYYTVKKNMLQLYCTHCWTVNNNHMIRPLYSTGLLENTLTFLIITLLSPFTNFH